MILSAPLRLWLFAVRVVDRLPGLRQLHWKPPLRRRYFPLRTAALVRPSLRFWLNEAARRPGLKRYTLRESGLTLHVRHPANDMWIVDEIFVQRCYEPPAEVARVIDGLGRAPRILDLGGHAGLFALFALGRFPGASVTSFEPHPENAASLDASLRANNGSTDWQLVRAAAGTEPGTMRVSGATFLTRVTADGDGTAVEVRDVLPLLDAVDVAKIDIENGEWPLLRDARLARAGVRALVLELHRDGGAPEDAVALLQEAGFRTGPLFDERPDTACVWAWRER